MLPLALVTDPEISDRAIRLYAVLRNYARYRDNAPLYSYPGSAGEVVLTNVLY